MIAIVALQQRATRKGMDSTPVFIVGTARSGTTLLYRTFLMHSAFAPHQLCLEETGVFQATSAYPFQADQHGSLYEYMLRDEAAYTRFKESVQGIAKKQRLGAILPSRLSRRFPLLWRLMGGAIIVHRYFRYAQEARGARRIVEKTPRHLHYLDHLFTAFPGARVLLVVRHPVDVFSSYRRRLAAEEEKGEGYKAWLDKSIDEFERRYRRDMETGAEQIQKRPERMRAVKYEDFVSNPHEEFRRLCAFVQVPFEGGPLEAECPSLRSWKVDPHLARPIRKNTKDWRDYMTGKEAGEMERRLAGVMERLGYEKYTSSSEQAGSESDEVLESGSSIGADRA